MFEELIGPADRASAADNDLSATYDVRCGKMVTYDRGGRSDSRIYLFDPLMGPCNNHHLPSKDCSQIPMFHVNNVRVGTRPPIRLSLMFQITWSWPSPRRHAKRTELTSSNSCPMNLASFLSKLSVQDLWEKVYDYKGSLISLWPVIFGDEVSYAEIIW